jgi:hypothetical protein
LLLVVGQEVLGPHHHPGEVVVVQADLEPVLGQVGAVALLKVR